MEWLCGDVISWDSIARPRIHRMTVTYIYTSLHNFTLTYERRLWVIFIHFTQIAGIFAGSKHVSLTNMQFIFDDELRMMNWWITRFAMFFNGLIEYWMVLRVNSTNFYRGMNVSNQLDTLVKTMRRCTNLLTKLQSHKFVVILDWRIACA